MAKKLYHFNEKSKFEEKKSEIPETSIVFVKDSNEIYTHEEEYQWVGWNVIKDIYVKKEDVIAGDICVVDTSGNKKFMRLSDDSSMDTIKSVGVTPIGVVVIPTSHDVYGTGECAIMSLKYMNYTTPNEGSISIQSIYWGGSGRNTSLYNYTTVATIGNSSEQTETVSFTTTSYLPSDTFTGPTCTKDTNASYLNAGKVAAPSPYLTDGSRNSQYYTNGNNALSDFDGVGNTNVLTSLVTGQSDWKTAISITNNSGRTYYPAACCCWRYSTVGTVQGDWYLPACGELGYLCARVKTINNAIQYLIDSGFSDSCSLVIRSSSVGGTFNSSSEYSGGNARNVNMFNGEVNKGLKNGAVRAFLRV